MSLSVDAVVRAISEPGPEWGRHCSESLSLGSKGDLELT